MSCFIAFIDLDCVDSAIGSLDSHCCPFARNLGVIIDSDFKFNEQISSTVKTTFFQLRQLAKVKSNLPRNDFVRVILTLVRLRLDNCNSLFIGLDQSALRLLQVVQNAAAPGFLTLVTR